MAQNIYDTNQFFDKYVSLDRQTVGLDGAPEWPTLRAMFPDLAGKRLLDLGCGFGWICRWAKEQGAASAHGVDLSENMLERARGMTRDASITYERADLEELTLPEAQYDVVSSSLAFHYLCDIGRLFKEISKSLKPGGKLVFTIEHPIFTAPTEGGFVTDPKGRKVWPVDAYGKEGLRLRTWFVDGVRKQHHTLGTYINSLLAAGFELTDFVEWTPTAEDLEKWPDWETDLMRPTFLQMGALKK